MGKRPSCRSCLHCVPPQAAQMGWCQLRRLAIHPELSAEVWCHHWTAQPPRLPLTAQGGPAGAVTLAEEPLAETDHQLAFTALMPEI
ncbi:MAG: hypothetical protein WCK64_09455 [Synechococcaceae cyanobacterium ELA445]